MLRSLMIAIVAAALVAASTVAHAIDDEITEYLTLPSGSYVVDMGKEPQDNESGLTPYGLVYDLILNYRVPVWWVINPNKTSNADPDFADYKGGPFAVHVDYIDPLVEAAIASWEGVGVIGEYTTTDILNVPVYDVMTACSVATLDSDHGDHAEDYLINAMIPSSHYAFEDPADLDACDDVFVMPDSDPDWGHYNNLLSLVAAGAYIWSGSDGVSKMEVIDDPGDPDPDPDLNFLSNNGLVKGGDHKDGTEPYTYDPAIWPHPIMQFMGDMDRATQEGPEHVYLPLAEGWRPGTTIAVYDPDHPDIPGLSPGEAAILAYGRAFGGPNQGVVMYEAGRDHDKREDPPNIAAQRAFLNFLLLTSIARRPEIASSIPSQVSSGDTITVGATVTGGAGGYAYSWTNNCGGAFTAPNSDTTDFIAPVTGVDLRCIIYLEVTDGCGRVVFKADALTILANTPPVANDDAAATVEDTPVAVDVLANDFDPDVEPITLVAVDDTTAQGGTASINDNGTPGEPADDYVDYDPPQGF